VTLFFPYYISFLLKSLNVSFQNNNAKFLFCFNVKVGPSYHARIGSPVSQWYIFNDFTINPIPPEEAVWFNLKWKIPCIICFTADLLPSSLEKLFYKVRASASLFII